MVERLKNRNLKETHKKAIVKRALELKKKYPYLSWEVIVQRLNGVDSHSHLKSLIKKYKGDSNDKKKL